jgi:23S rRNA (uracil1939-C5)-methyltransferase
VSQAIEAGAFAQVNPLAAAELYRRVKAEIGGSAEVLDLYSGSGGIALTLASPPDAARSVYAVEAHPDAVRAARASAEAMGLGGVVKFEEAAVEDALGRAPVGASAIVLNPPRKGASRAVLEAIVERAPLRLVYVSCNPESLARDVAILGAAAELEIDRVTPVDLFPQTLHVETVLSARLTRATSATRRPA